MPENTKEKDIILKNLDYIGLNLEELPDFLTIYKDNKIFYSKETYKYDSKGHRHITKENG